MDRCVLELGGTAAVPRKRAAAAAVVGGSCRARDDAFGFFGRTTHRTVPLLEGYPEEYSDDESVRREARKARKKAKKDL